MALKIPVFKIVEPTHLIALQKDLRELISVDSLFAILSACFEKIKNHESLDRHELQLMIDWNSKIPNSEAENVRKYIDGEISRNTEAFNHISEYFKDLKSPAVLPYLITLPFIAERLTHANRVSFKNFLEGSLEPTKTRGAVAISYVENLFLVESTQYTAGQITQAVPFINASDFSEQFELEFEKLVEFLKQCRIESPGALSKILDQQLGRLLLANEAEVTAKAFHPKLGYLKYKSFIENSGKSLAPSSLPNYQKLLRLISRFEEAVTVLSEQEIKRGTFWKSVITQIDGIKFQNEINSKYRVAVAFFVGNFVFCDFGPTGNQIHIYDRAVFVERVEKSKNWQVQSLTTSALSSGLYGHVGHWQERTKDLIREARRNG